jgi:hypothetical protein
MILLISTTPAAPLNSVAFGDIVLMARPPLLS